MRWEAFAAAPLVVLAAPGAQATEYLTVAQAQAALFPGSSFQKVAVAVPEAVLEAMRERSGVDEPFNAGRIWRVSTGGWFIVDAVLGKHEKITYAVGIDASGAVRGIEILTYNESYGYEVRDPGWRAQFRGKTAASALQLNGDIRNITGATLSSKHLTQGVKRLLVLHQMALARS